MGNPSQAEILDEDEYSQLKEHYIAEKQRLEHELQKQRQRALELEKRIKICDAQMERMRGILNQNEFDEELVHELIKRIYVGMDNSVEVEFKCSDPYQEVLAIMTPDGEIFATNSPTFKEDFFQMQELFQDMGETVHAISVISGISKAGREFISCAYED